MAEGSSEFEVIWAVRAVDKLTSMLEDARHAQGNPDWVIRKLEECLTEGIRRLTAFPDLRNRYQVNGQWCNGMTLRVFPAQVFYRITKAASIVIFSCRWARQDVSGPSNP
jgi:hypothetical protein